MRIPCGSVPCNQMLLQPLISAAAAASQHFVAKAAQRPYFREIITQLSYGIIYLNLPVSLMPFFHNLLHFLLRDERVIDERIVFIGVVYVHHVATVLDRF